MRTVHLAIANPCHEDWDSMDGESCQRFCQSCQKSVHNLSEMTEQQASTLLRARPPEGLCVRYAHDRAGNVRFRSGPGRQAPRPRSTIAGAFALMLAACTPHEHESEPEVIMGAIPVDVSVVPDDSARVEPPPVMGQMPLVEDEPCDEPDEVVMGEKPAEPAPPTPAKTKPEKPEKPELEFVMGDM